MAALNKIIKNTTSATVFVPDVGISLDAFAIYDITESELLMWVASIDVVSLINSGALVVNNGAIDLTPDEGIRYLQYPDRLDIQQNSTTVTRVTTAINFTGNVTVTDNDDGKATVNVFSGAAAPALREVTAVVYPFGFVNTDSNLLFEYDVANNLILFLKEEII
jgi:hypothetical protein